MGAKIYTRTGDKGETAHPSMQSRVAKNHPHLSLVGTLDELNSIIGLALVRTEAIEDKTNLNKVIALLTDTQKCLLTHFHVVFVSMLPGPDVSSSEAIEKARNRFGQLVVDMEQGIDEMTAALEPLEHFILPGGGEAGATLHIARTVCRRAERRMITVTDDFSTSTIFPFAAKFVNRLSDYLFAAARMANAAEGLPETKI